MDTITRAFTETLALLLPVDCSGCGAFGRSVCGDCAASLLVDPLRRSIDGIPVASACSYDGPVARMISSFKDSGRIDAAGVLSVALGRAVADVLREGASSPVAGSGTGRVADSHADPAVNGILAVPIPGSRSAFRRRGYDPVRVLARRAGVPVHRVLRLTRRVADQASLGFEERQSNRSGALLARRRLDGASILLLDDVVTTGATLRDAIRAIRDAGGRVVGAATVAATPLRRRS